MNKMNWQTNHERVIKQFLDELNKETHDFILKGGTSLKQCYQLDRFSEDIDLDVRNNKNLIDYVDKFTKAHNYSYRISKNTETVKRCFINYGNSERPLKIEASYRLKNIPDAEFTTINGISVYTINRIAQMKATAYSQRDKIRDLYDVTFICNNYFEQLTNATKNILQDALANKGIEQLEYLEHNETDELIDTNKLENDFLKAYDKIGLLKDNRLSTQQTTQEPEVVYNVHFPEKKKNEKSKGMTR